MILQLYLSMFSGILRYFDLYRTIYSKSDLHYMFHFWNVGSISLVFVHLTCFHCMPIVITTRVTAVDISLDQNIVQCFECELMTILCIVEIIQSCHRADLKKYSPFLEPIMPYTIYQVIHGSSTTL